MRKNRLLSATAAVAVVVVVVAVAGGGGQQPLVLITSSSGTGGGPVEQQSPNVDGWQAFCQSFPEQCVFNRTPEHCAWTADSNVKYAGTGVLAAKATASAAGCLVADWQQHIVGVRVTSGSPNLVVTLSWQPQGQTFVFIARPFEKGYEYRGCVKGPFYSGRLGGPNDPQLVAIPDSNGGVGVFSNWNLSVVNPTGRNLHSVSAQMELGSSAPTRITQYCQGDTVEDAFVAGGAIWGTGL